MRRVRAGDDEDGDEDHDDMVDDSLASSSSPVAASDGPLSARAARAIRRSAEKEKYECTFIAYDDAVGPVHTFTVLSCVLRAYVAVGTLAVATPTRIKQLAKIV